MWNITFFASLWTSQFSIWTNATVGKIVKHTWQRPFLCSAGICRTWHSLAPALNLNTACSPLLACCTTVKNANMHSCRIRWSLFKFACKSQLPDSSLLRGTEFSSTQPYSSCIQGVGIYCIRAQVSLLQNDPVPHSDWIKDVWFVFWGYNVIAFYVFSQHFLQSSVQYNTLNILTFVYFSHTGYISTENGVHHRAVLK
jgi:hypothetical protein